MPTPDLVRESIAAARRHAWVLSAMLFLPSSLGCPRAAEPIHLQVAAASSLTEAFETLARMFERAHPEAQVELTFAGSQVLRVQIEQGARFDVFASANPQHMEALEAKRRVGAPVVLAENELTLIVPNDNPSGIGTFDDLPKARRLILGSATAPVGRYARRVLDLARGLWGDAVVADIYRRVVSEESNARLVRAKIELGEADAALVYRTDAAASTRVRSIPLPPELAVRARYLMAVVGDAPHPELARAWVDLCRSPAGRRVLVDRGFANPP